MNSEIVHASFRDPSGQLVRSGDRVIRIVYRDGEDDLRAFLESSTARKYVSAGHVVRTEFLEASAAEGFILQGSLTGLPDRCEGPVLLEHERIPFESYPYEWPPEMLYAAATLTLDLAGSLLEDELGLKDATPYNVLYRGSMPVFVDVLSFERRDPGDPIWLPYGQFVRTFLLPLLVNRQFGVPISESLSHRRDGLEPEDVYRMASPLRRLMPSFLSLVSIPTLLGARRDPDQNKIYQKRIMRDAAKAKFVLRSLIGRLRRQLKRQEPRPDRTSSWSEYMVRNNNYSEDHFAAKERFVEGVLAEFAPAMVLDVGCNTGHFSAAAARAGASVVAIDSDPVVVGGTWHRARDEKLDILPLCVNLANPTPAMGWRNLECRGFLERARARFDCVFMLAVLHHMLVTERVPLYEIIDLAAELTTDLLIVEFIEPGDSMFERLVRGRAHLFSDLTRSVFETACRESFDIERVQHLEGTKRWLYQLRKKGRGPASRRSR